MSIAIVRSNSASFLMHNCLPCSLWEGIVKHATQKFNDKMIKTRLGNMQQLSNKMQKTLFLNNF
ncbi:hypothetical protein AYI97_02180 [Shewanella algae]|nr:hypothetical protein AYI97_02180 [Shewanella algae]TVL18839.1 hypothetical protein AYJ02_01210 [Shewanella algae]